MEISERQLRQAASEVDDLHRDGLSGSGGGASASSGSATDITILRTASSLEALAVYTYQQATKSGLVTTRPWPRWRLTS